MIKRWKNNISLYITLIVCIVAAIGIVIMVVYPISQISQTKESAYDLIGQAGFQYFGIGKGASRESKKSLCVDSDRGYKIYTKGAAVEYLGGKPIRKYPDFCDKRLGKQREAVCEKGKARYISAPCPKGYKCQDNACVISTTSKGDGTYAPKEGTIKHGLVLVQKDSTIEEISEEIAKEKDWRFSSILKEVGEDDIDFAKKVKQGIVEEYNKENFNYLLIVGVNDNIPLIDSNWEIFSRESLPEKQVPVLDSLYYGDVDDDGFIELAVGRLPFDNPEDIQSYFDELKTQDGNAYSVSATNIGYHFCKCESEGEEVDCDCDTQDICLSQTFDELQYVPNPNNEDLSDMLQNSKYFSIATHGGTGWWCLGNFDEQCSYAFPSSELPNMKKNKPIILSSACLTAQSLGVETLRKGASAFVGSYPTGAIEGEGYIFANYLLGGESIGNSFKEQLNLAIAKEIVRDTQDDAILNTASERVTPSGYTYVLYGDPSLKLPKSTAKIDKISFSKENEKTKLLILPPYQMILNDVVINCYGKNVLNIPIFYKDNYDKTVNVDKIITIGLKVDLEQIEKAYITIGDKEYLLKEGDTVSLVKGNGESYLILNLLINEFNDPISVEIE